MRRRFPGTRMPRPVTPAARPPPHPKPPPAAGPPAGRQRGRVTSGDPGRSGHDRAGGLDRPRRQYPRWRICRSGPYPRREARVSMSWGHDEADHENRPCCGGCHHDGRAGSSFLGTEPGGWRAVPQGAACPEAINRGVRRSIEVPTPLYRHVLRALARELAASMRLNQAFYHARAWPFALRFARCPTHPLLAGGRARHGQVAEETGG